MPKKQRAFFDWQQQAVRIMEAGPDFDLSDLDQCNHTELVQLARLLNPDGAAHMAMERSMLEDIVLHGVVPTNPPDNKVDRYRARMHQFIQEHWDKIRDQMEMSCTGDCYQCHDFMVLGCFVANADHLKESPYSG